MKIFGGFAGTETHLSERDWIQHPTVLSGEIGDTSTTEDNSYHVLRGRALDATTLLDGLQIERGRANAPFSAYYERLGAGLFLFADEVDTLCVPLIRNCHFRNNEASDLGGAVYAHRHNIRPYQADPRFIHCVFSHNSATEGSAVYKSGTTAGYPLVFDYCTFQANESTLGGVVELKLLTDSLLLTNCHFLNNHSLGASSGVGLTVQGRNMFVRLENSVFADNIGARGGAMSMDSHWDDQCTHIELEITH